MEEILASIRRIISDEDEQTAEGAPESSAGSTESTESEAASDMGDASEMNQDDLDKLFDMDDSDIGGVEDEQSADDDMAAAMAEVAEAESDDDVLELTEDFAILEDDGAVDSVDIEMVGDEDIAFVEGTPSPAEAEDDLDFSSFDLPEEPAPEPAPTPTAAKPAAKAASRPQASVQTSPVPDDLPDVDNDDPLTSDNTNDAVHAAFDNLSNLFVGNQPQTMEELVREMLRPMLKGWLDQNLPGMVEELVKKEIDRVTRRR